MFSVTLLVKVSLKVLEKVYIYIYIYIYILQSCLSEQVELMAW